MILAAILIVATGLGQVATIPTDGRDQTPRAWLRCQDRQTKELKWVWGWKSNHKIYHYEDEQATAPVRIPEIKYPTGVDIQRFASETSPRDIASDAESAKIVRQILSQDAVHSHANGQCPDGQPCPLRPPKKPDEKTKIPEVPVKLDWNIRVEYIIAIVLVVAGIIAISGGGQRAE